MADDGVWAESGAETHLTQEELDIENESEGRRAGPTRIYHGGRFWLGLVAVIVAVLVGLIVFIPRTTHCSIQVIQIPGTLNATYQQCAPPGQHGGFINPLP